MPVISLLRTATDTTHGWTKLHTQIMSWVSGVHEFDVHTWPLLPEVSQPPFTI